MTRRITSKNIDIYQFPSEFEDSLGSVTLGDLHGNFIKLIYFLFRHKCIQFKTDVTDAPETYLAFVSLYERYGEIVANYMKKQTLHKTQLNQIIAQFNQLMNTLEVSNTNILARLIGDEVADRGNCDYFTLRLIDFFHQSKGKMTIITSNHGSEFIIAYERLMSDQIFKPSGVIPDTLLSSFYGLKLLLENEIINKDELANLINNSYKPLLKIIDYSLGDEGITLYSHAPIRFDTIELLAKQFAIGYGDQTKEILADTIDQINAQFQTYLAKDTVRTLLNNTPSTDLANLKDEVRPDCPLSYAIWNRWNEAKENDSARPPRKNNYDILYIHGHDAFQSKLAHVHNLDTPCGKSSRKEDDERVNKSFKFLLDSYRYTNVDKSFAEDYIRTVRRYIVFDTDEYQLPNFYYTSNSSIRALSGLGKPINNNNTAQPAVDNQALPKSMINQATSHLNELADSQKLYGMSVSSQ